MYLWSVQYYYPDFVVSVLFWREPQEKKVARPRRRAAPPSSEAHLVLFGRKKRLRTKISVTTSQPFNYAEIDRPDDGNALIVRELSDALLAKICWGILTP